MTTSVQKMIVWASGMIEFIGDDVAPNGAIHVCTARGEDAINRLLQQVHQHSCLHAYDDKVALRVPEIDSRRPHVEVGVDPAIDALIDWQDCLWQLLREADIEWSPDHG